MKTFPSICLGLLRYGARQALKRFWGIFFVLELVTVTVGFAERDFFRIQADGLLMGLGLWALLTLFVAGTSAYAWKNVLGWVKKDRRRDPERCQAFLHQEARKLGVHIADRQVTRKAEIFFRERTITRTLLAEH